MVYSRSVSVVCGVYRRSVGIYSRSVCVVCGVYRRSVWFYSRSVSVVCGVTVYRRSVSYSVKTLLLYLINS